MASVDGAIDLAPEEELNSEGSAPADPGRGALRARSGRRAIVLAAIFPGLLTIGVCVYQMGLRNVLYGAHEYDDGVYTGAALASYTVLSRTGILCCSTHRASPC